MSSTSASPPLTTWELVKMTLPIMGFGILLPIVDNLTDLRMIIRLYSGIYGCKYVRPWDYVGETNGTWEDLFTCQQDPDTYCQDNSESLECHYFFRNGYPDDIVGAFIPGCRRDYYACVFDSDPVTFCENNPHRIACGHYKHVKFATMFLGNYFGFAKNLKKPFSFQSHLC